MAKPHKIPNIHVKRKNMTLDVDMERVENNVNRAQYLLDSAVMSSMVPYMPMQTAVFVNTTRGMSQAIAGSGKVYAAAPPYGQFLYEGETMVDVQTGSTFAREGAKKVTVSQFGRRTKARPNLQYSTHAHPKATDHWFEEAKEKDLTKWENVVKRQMGK